MLFADLLNDQFWSVYATCVKSCTRSVGAENLGAGINQGQFTGGTIHHRGEDGKGGLLGVHGLSGFGEG